MSDPSFILQGAAAKDMRDMARGLQALVDERSAAAAQPVIDIDFPLDLQEILPASGETVTQ